MPCKCRAWIPTLYFGQGPPYVVVMTLAASLLLAGIFVLLGGHHQRMLPRPAADTAPLRRSAGGLMSELFGVFGEFFRKPGIVTVVGFLLLYRFPAAQLLKRAPPFLPDPVSAGGLGLSTKQVSMPSSLLFISTALAIEQFGYGLGFTAYLMFMILVADGKHKTAHYAICTGFMALGKMIPGMWSGWLQQQQLGYVLFFAWVMVSPLPSFGLTALLKIPADFGKKTEPDA